MQRRCIICGQEPNGYYLYPRTLTEARKWQDWTNMYSFNVPVGTLRKHGCVCQKHIEAVDEVEKTEDKDVEVVQNRIMGGMPTPIQESAGLISSDVQEREKRTSVNFTDSRPDQRKAYQQSSQCSCSNSQTTSEQQQSNKQNQKPQVQNHLRKKMKCNPAISFTSVSQNMEDQQQSNVKVCYCPACTQIPRPPFQYDARQTVPSWYTNQANQHLQKQQQQHQMIQQQQRQMIQQQQHQMMQQNQRMQQQQQRIQRHRKSSDISQEISAYTGQSSKSSQQDQNQWFQSSRKVSDRNQEMQCPSQPYHHKIYTKFAQSPVAAGSQSNAAASRIKYAPKKDTCECGTTTSQMRINACNCKKKTKKKLRKVRQNPNAVNVLIMGAFGQKETDETDTPATFQPSPLTEICLLESHLTKTNERAIFPDIDLPKFSVCRAATNDPNTDKIDNGTNPQDENCADVLVLGKGLKDIDPCPCNCGHCLFDNNFEDCINHTKPDAVKRKKNESIAESGLPVLKELMDKNSQNPEAQNDQVIAEQRARINELKLLLDQHNILQQTIQSKVNELHSKAQENGVRR